MLSITELFSDPYGPWADSVVLSPAFKSTKTNVMCLKRVRLSRNGIPVGLTSCEPSMPEYRSSGVPIRICGVLEIKSLSWLSPVGHQLLQEAVRQKDGPNSRLTLNKIYGQSSIDRNPQLNAKIWVEAEKLMSAGYLTSTLVPNGLYLKTVDQNRFFEVISLDLVTFTKSRLYLSRYRALRVLKSVCEYDLAHSDQPTPQLERTPRWFARMYLRLMDHSSDPQSPPVHLSSDSETYHTSADTRRIRPNLRRPLRSTSRTEVESQLLRHRQWLIRDQELVVQKSKRLFDTEVWASWSQRERETESESPAPPPLPDQEEEENDDDMYAVPDQPVVKEEQDAMDIDDNDDVDLPDYSDSPSPPPIPPMSEKRKGKRKASPESDLPQNSAGPPPEELDAEDWDQKSPSPPHRLPSPVDQDGMRSYDAEFSPPSTPDWSGDSDDSRNIRAPTPPSPTLLAAIPPCFFHPPTPPGYSFKWYCPLDECLYMIDLLQLSDENRRALQPQDVRKFERGGWTLSDRWVLKCFAWMVSQHWTEHLDRLGIVLRKVDDQTKLEWKHPESHLSTHLKVRRQKIEKLENSVDGKDEPE